MNRYGVLLLAVICLLGTGVLWAQEQRQVGRDRRQENQRNQGGQRRGGVRGQGSQQNRSSQSGGPDHKFISEVPKHAYDIILGRPTQDSVTVSLLAYENMQGYLEYGITTSEDTTKTDIQSLRKGEPLPLLVDALEPNTAYTYRFCWRSDESTPFKRSKRYGFHTQRPPGESFVFTVQADAHLDINTDVRRYQQTLVNALASEPDFHIDLGDTFMTDKYGRDYTNAHAQYLAQRYYFGQLCHSAPLFLVLGNHDGEKGTGRNSSMLSWSLETRKKYYPNPYPNGFYSGNSMELTGTGLRENYYAWQWGDALFMVLDPYMSTQSRPRKGESSWTRSLGKTQYLWLVNTLENSAVKYKFLFIHHLVGGLDRNGRGGSEAAGLFEWGGHNPDGSSAFKEQRPGWDIPIHSVLVKNKVSVVFHGHDHFYAKQDLDGIVYQLVPQPGHIKTQNGAPRSAAEYGYHDGVLLGNSGHLRVSVTPTLATIDYVRSVLPGEEAGGPQNGEVVHSYTINPNHLFDQ